MQGKGSPQLWLVGSGGQIVCLHSPQLTPIILRCDSGGQKPDVTSFFDGFISLLPVGSSPSFSSKKDSEEKIHPKHNRKYEDSRHLQQHKHAVATGFNFPASPSAPTAHSSVPETDIKQLKHVLDTINTTKAVAKITLTQQVRRYLLTPCCFQLQPYLRSQIVSRSHHATAGAPVAPRVSVFR